MYAYCNNNPVNLADNEGNSAYDILNPNPMCRYDSIDGAGGGGGVGTGVGIVAVLSAIAAPFVMAGTYLLTEAYCFFTILFSQPFDHSQRVAKADAEIQKKVKESSKVRYWSATLHAGYVDIGRPLTFNQAVREVKSGRSVFAVTWFEAKNVAVAAGGRSGYNNKQLIPEIDSGKDNTPGYYYHYHTYNRSGGHVYYLFGEV